MKIPSNSFILPMWNIYQSIHLLRAFLVAKMVKMLCLQCRKPGFNPWVRKIPWRSKCYPFQYFCLESSMDRGAWRATVHGVAESDTTKQLTHFIYLLISIYCLSIYLPTGLAKNPNKLFGQFSTEPYIGQTSLTLTASLHFSPLSVSHTC